MALALMTVLATALVSATASGVRLLDRSGALGEVGAELALRLRLRHWLGTAIAPAGVGFPTAFSGREDRLAFTTLTPDGLSSDATALRVEVMAVAGQLRLTALALDDDGSVVHAFDRVLLDRAPDVEITYLSGRPGEATWLRSWTDEASLPLAVRIRTETRSRPAWPVFSVALIYAAPPS